MVTKRHPSAYATLFARANDVLRKYGSTEHFRNVNIETIDDYFACLAELAKIELDSEKGIIAEKIDPIFTILPATEERFHILADTREIEIPPAFSKGVAVKGDEIAEIIYFDIDRYFDAMDLAEMDMIIQWKHEKDTNEAGQLSAVYKKSLTLENGKIIFGWPITSEVTERPGKILFSIRFYRRELDTQGNQILVYSFSTLTYPLTIQPGLDFELSDELLMQTINRNDKIYSNLRNSEKASLTYIIAVPKIVGYYTLDGENLVAATEDKTYDLPVNMVLKAEIPKDTKETDYISASGLNYQWYRKENINSPDSESVEITNGITSHYVLVADADRTQNKYNNKEIYYYIINNNGVLEYWPYSKNGDSYPFDDTDDNGDLIPLYTRHSKFSPAEAGYYYSIVRNTYAPGEEASDKSQLWYVPYAQEPTYTYPDNTVIILPEGETVTLNIGANVTDGGSIANLWYRNAEQDNANTAEIYKNAIGEEVTTNSCEVHEEGYYYLKATNNKNNSQSKTYSNALQVVFDADEPEINQHTVNGVGRTEFPTVCAVGDLVAIKVDAPKHGSISYQWLNNNEPIIGATNNYYSITAAGSYVCQVTNTYKGLTKTKNSEQFIVV